MRRSRASPIRAGIIGVDTSHAVAFTTLLKDPKAPKELAQMKIVAAYPVGSPDIPASQEKIGEYTEKLRGMGVEIVGSTDELLKRVDAVLVESVDGRPHLAQARAAILAGKPVFVDKPMAASLADAMQIFRLAKEKHVPCFSASSLRFSKGFQAVRNGKAGFGPVRSCMAWSPMHTEPHHPDFFWYGIHGVETLFTIMGPGCKTVIRTGPESAVGVWKDGRVGDFPRRQRLWRCGERRQEERRGRRLRRLCAAGGRDREVLPDRQAARQRGGDPGDHGFHGGGRSEQAAGRRAGEHRERHEESGRADRGRQAVGESNALQNWLRLICAAIVLTLVVQVALAAGPAKRLRAGMIGLDTSHVVEFVNLLNNPKAKGELAEMTVVAAYPGGSPDLPISWDRVKGFTDTLRKKGVKIVDSIPELLEQVDVILLESVDGRPHLAQARPVIAAGKPLFIDKPMAASLADAIQIFRLAKAKNVPCFSASSLRFGSGAQAVRNGTAGFGAVRGCTAWMPGRRHSQRAGALLVPRHPRRRAALHDHGAGLRNASRKPPPTRSSAAGKTAAKASSWPTITARESQPMAPRSKAARKAATPASRKAMPRC